MSDEAHIANSEPMGNPEANISPAESPDNTQVNNQDVQTQAVENQEPVQGNEQPATEPTEPQKIKLGDKEYTQEQLQEYAQQVEAQKAQQESQFQPRELEVIDTELGREYKNLEAEFTTFNKYFLAKAENPIISIQDPETGEIVQHYQYDYTPEQAFQRGFFEGDWTYFERLLPPQEINKFRQDLGKVNESSNKYNNLQAEKAKQEDLGKWNSFIGSNYKDKPAESYFLNKIKNGFGFDEQSTKQVMQWMREAIELEKNQQQLTQENNAGKQAMMNSSINGNQPASSSGKIYTRAEVAAMSPKQFAIHEKTIFDQMAKGLIK